MRKPVLDNWIRQQAANGLSFGAFDRFGTVLRLRPRIYGALLRSPLHSGDSWSYLVLGDRQALVIDTGFGIGDLRGVWECLAEGRELMLFNTHAHPDHVLGNSQFDRVYISEYDAPALKTQSFTDYQRESGRPVCDHSFYGDSDVIPASVCVPVPVKDGFAFDIGGCAFECFLLSGHSAGGMALLDKRDRVLFTGDAIMYPFPTPLRLVYNKAVLYPELCTVAAFIPGLSKLEKRTAEFDCIFDGHGIPGGPNCLAADMLRCAEDIVAAPDSGFEVIHTWNGDVKCKRCGGAAIHYCDQRVGSWSGSTGHP